MKADPLLPLYREQHGARAGRDRLELLTALIDGPAFDPLFRGEVIRIPARHPVFRWACLVAGCERPRKGSLDMCHVHREQWAQAQARGDGMAAFLAAAQPLGPSVWVEQVPCRICPGRPATHTGWRLCHRHYMRWYRRQRGEGQQASFEDWLAESGPVRRVRTLPGGRLPGPGGHAFGPVLGPRVPVPDAGPAGRHGTAAGLVPQL